MEIAVKIVGVLHIIVALIIIAVILLQQAKKPGMSGVLGGNMDNSYYGRNKGRTRDGILAKATAICAVVFLCTSLFLAYNFAITNKMNESTGTDTGVESTLPMDSSGSLTVPTEDATEDVADEAGTAADEGASEAQAPADEETQTPAE